MQIASHQQASKLASPLRKRGRSRAASRVYCKKSRALVCVPEFALARSLDFARDDRRLQPRGELISSTPIPPNSSSAQRLLEVFHDCPAFSCAAGFAAASSRLTFSIIGGGTSHHCSCLQYRHTHRLPAGRNFQLPELRRTGCPSRRTWRVLLLQHSQLSSSN